MRLTFIRAHLYWLTQTRILKSPKIKTMGGRRGDTLLYMLHEYVQPQMVCFNFEMFWSENGRYRLCFTLAWHWVFCLQGILFSSSILTNLLPFSSVKGYWSHFCLAAVVCESHALLLQVWNRVWKIKHFGDKVQAVHLTKIFGKKFLPHFRLKYVGGVPRIFQGGGVTLCQTELSWHFLPLL